MNRGHQKSALPHEQEELNRQFEELRIRFEENAQSLILRDGELKSQSRTSTPRRVPITRFIMPLSR
jgi:hypothetical protein